jgi:hypothetical protein
MFSARMWLRSGGEQDPRGFEPAGTVIPCPARPRGGPASQLRSCCVHAGGRERCQQHASNGAFYGLGSIGLSQLAGLSSWGNKVEKAATQAYLGPRRSLHTAEVTGSIPVTPTSQNASHPRSRGPFARRFARRPPPGVVDPWSAWLDQARRRAGHSWSWCRRGWDAARLARRPDRSGPVPLG